MAEKPSVTAIIMAATRDKDECRKFYLSERDFGTEYLSAEAATVVANKLRNSFETYNLARHSKIRIFENGVRGDKEKVESLLKLNTLQGGAPLEPENYAAIFKVDFDLKWEKLERIRSKFPPYADASKVSPFLTGTMTSEQRAARLFQFSEDLLNFLSDTDYYSDSVLGSIVRLVLFANVHNFIAAGVREDLENETGFRLPASLLPKMKVQNGSNPLKFLHDIEFVNLIRIANYSEQHGLSQLEFEELFNKHSRVADPLVAMRGILAEVIVAPKSSFGAVISVARDRHFELLVESSFSANSQIRRDPNWQKLPVWLARVSENNLELVRKVLSQGEAASCNQLVLRIRNEKKSAKLFEEEKITKPAQFTEVNTERCDVSRELIKDRGYLNFYKSLTPATQTLFNRTCEKLSKKQGRYPRLKGVRNTIFEAKIHTECGYRIYFGVKDNKIILLNAGIKKTQDHDIQKADLLMELYK